MLKVWIGCLLLLGVSVYTLARPDRFGMRLGVFSYYPMPNSPWAKILGWGGIILAIVLFAVGTLQNGFLD